MVEVKSFDINALYRSWRALHKEMTPYKNGLVVALNILRGKDANKFRIVLLACAAGVLFNEFALPLVHVALAVLLIALFCRKELVANLVERAKRLFVEFDRDGNGSLDRTELGVLLEKLIPAAENTEIDRVFRVYAKNNRLDLDGFISLVRERTRFLVLSEHDDETLDLDAAVIIHLSETIRVKKKKLRRALSKAARAHDDDKKGLVSSMTAAIIDMVGNAFFGAIGGRILNLLEQCTRLLRAARGVVEWDNPVISCAAILANLLMALWHWFVPFRITCLILVCGVFFFSSGTSHRFLVFVKNVRAKLGRRKIKVEANKKPKVPGHHHVLQKIIDSFLLAGLRLRSLVASHF